MNFLSFEKFSLLENKNLAYKDIFGKEHTHQEELKKSLVNGLLSILEEEKHISEKDFSKIDENILLIKSVLNEEHYSKAEEHLQSGRRMSLFYEMLYEELKEQLK